MANLPQISGIIANQAGKLQGELEARILGEITKIQDKFINECPDSDAILETIEIQNKLLNSVNLFYKRIQKYRPFVSKLEAPLTIARNAVLLLKSLPLPSSVPPGVGIPVGVLNTFSDSLAFITRTINSIDSDVSSANDLLDSTISSLDNARDNLKSVSLKMETCVGALEDSEIKTKLLNKIQPAINTGTEGIPLDSKGNLDTRYEYRSSSGKDYTLLILNDPSFEINVPRRVAVAKNRNGVVVIRGDSSFSSDTQVLLDELKFKIENQLL